MSDPLFQEAYARARSHYSDNGWLALNPREITEVIYEAIRQIDAERLAAQAKVATSRRGAARSHDGPAKPTTRKRERLATPAGRSRLSTPPS